jgi:segregation and condensation protein B
MNETMTGLRLELKGIIEAMIFASDEPLSVKTLKDVFDASEFDGQRLEIEPDEIKRVIDELNAGYSSEQRSFRIIEIAGGYQYATVPKFSSWVGKIFKEKARRRLSQSAMESLAIISYKQPVTKPDLEYIRGVNCDYVLKTLLERNLVAIIGRASTPGRPLLYGTTQDFLRHFGLNSLSDLPKPREIEELLGETELEVDKRLLEEQQMSEEEEIETAQKPKDSGPRFKKPLIPGPRSDALKKKAESPDQIPLPIPQVSPAEQKPDDSVTETAVPETTEIQEEKIEIVEAVETRDSVTIPPVQSMEEEDQIQSSAPDVRPVEESDETQPEEKMTWEQIPEEQETQNEALHPGITEPTLEELNAVVQARRERGWSKFRSRIRDLIHRLFG